MVTREWVAIHRKHHARCETAEDPHSPQVYGIWRVLFGGVGLVSHRSLQKGHARDLRPRHARRLARASRLQPLPLLRPRRHARDRPRLVRLGRARRSSPCRWSGSRSGPPASSTASATTGAIATSRRRTRRATSCRSASSSAAKSSTTTITRTARRRSSPTSGGSSTSAGSTSARSSCSASPSVKKVAPRASFSRATTTIDLDTLRAVVTNRFYLLKLYGRRVIAPVLHGHAAGEPSFPRRQLARVRKLMIRENSGLREDPHVRQWLDNALQRNHTVRTVYAFMHQPEGAVARRRRARRSPISSACKRGAPKPKPAAFECSATSRDNYKPIRHSPRKTRRIALTTAAGPRNKRSAYRRGSFQAGAV